MGAIARQLPGTFSAADYLTFLESRPDDERWQLLDGVAVMMTPPTLVHQVIAMNLAGHLNEALRTHRPDLLALVEAGLKVPGRPAFLPQTDVVVVDIPVDYISYANRIFLTAEIKSESNTKEYMALKRERYTEHPDNLYTMVVDQRKMRLQLWSRADGWKGLVVSSPDDILEMPEFGLRCQLRDLYRGTPLA